MGLLVNGQSVSAPSVQEGNAVVYSLTLNQEGTFTVLAQGVDLNGITRSSSRSFSIDKTPPKLVLSGATNGGQYNGAQVVFGVLDASDLAVGGLTATLNGQPYVSGTPIGLDGDYTVVVAAVDRAGNRSSTNVAFVVDTVAPVVTVTGVDANAYYSNNVTIQGSVTDAHLASSRFILNGTVIALPQTVTAEAPHHLRGEGADKAGNVAVKNLDFRIDRTLPVVVIDGIQEGGRYSRAAFNFRVYEDTLDLAKTSILLDSTELKTQLVSMTDAMAAPCYGLAVTNFTNQGLHRLSYVVTDLAKNKVSNAVAFQVSAFEVGSNLTAYASYDRNTKLDYAQGSTNEYSGVETVVAGGYRSNAVAPGVAAGDYVVYYRSDDNIREDKGTVGIWLKPVWSNAGSTPNTIFALKNSASADTSTFALKAHVTASEGTVWAVKNKNNTVFKIEGEKGKPEGQRWYAKGEWTHLVLTWDYSAGLMALYANGVSLGQASISGSPKDNSAYILVGATKNGSMPASQSFRGKMDEFKVLNRSLTADEVQLLYQAERE
jgi:hypothetical protein